MRTLIGFMACVLCASFVPTVRAADEVKEQPTLMCDRGAVLLSEDFTGTALSAEWKHPKGQWVVADGAVKGAEVAADMHAAVLQHPLKTHDLVAQFSFKLDGGKMTAFSLNDTHGHVCRVSITPAAFALAKDKANRTSTDKPAPLDRVTGAIKPGEWHTMVVEVRGKEMVASLDGGERVGFGANDGIDVDKTVLAFPVSGDSVSIAHVRVWEAKPKEGWEATKAKLLAGKSKQAAGK